MLNLGLNSFVIRDRETRLNYRNYISIKLFRFIGIQKDRNIEINKERQFENKANRLMER